MFTKELQYLIQEYGNVEDVYSAVQRGDAGGAVAAAAAALRRVGALPIAAAELAAGGKSGARSLQHRLDGNAAYRRGDYHRALHQYNLALATAPHQSRELLLAYSNRSALLFRIEAYKECSEDVDACISMDGVGDVFEKLSDRKAKCHQLMPFQEQIIFKEDVAGFWDVSGRCNADVTCASADVQVEREAGAWRVFAACDIPVGAVVANEKPYVNQVWRLLDRPVCYGCKRPSLRLLPCATCAFAMFCNETCREASMREGHSIECHLGKIVNYLPLHIELATKAMISLRRRCRDWKEFIDASYDTGGDKNSSTVNEVFDVNDKLSVLRVEPRAHFTHGPMYNHSFIAAVVLQALEEVPGYLPPPATRQRDDTLRALATVLMTLYASFRTTCVTADTRALHMETDSTPIAVVTEGWYSFTSKLQHSCNPNLLVMGLNDRIALVACRPIRKGDDLQISFTGHYYMSSYKERKLILFSKVQIACECRVCEEQWTHQAVDDELTKYVSLSAACAALEAHDARPNTRSHCAAFRRFLAHIACLQAIATKNVLYRSIPL